MQSPAAWHQQVMPNDPIGGRDIAACCPLMRRLWRDLASELDTKNLVHSRFVARELCFQPREITVYRYKVGGLEHVLFFPFVGNFIIPTDELIFFRGLGQPPASIDIRLLYTSVTTLMVVVGLVLWARRVATRVATLVVCRRKGLFMPETCLVCFRDAIFKRTATTKPLCSFGNSSLPEELTCSLFLQGSMDGKHMVSQNPRRCTLW